MAKQIKARKHALRKMITSAVLAGTAITTIGGAMGSVTTVKADSDRLTLEEKMEALRKVVTREVLIGYANNNPRFGFWMSLQQLEKEIDKTQRLTWENKRMEETLKSKVERINEAGVLLSKKQKDLNEAEAKITDLNSKQTDLTNQKEQVEKELKDTKDKLKDSIANASRIAEHEAIRSAGLENQVKSLRDVTKSLVSTEIIT
ncbi:hypothetical protein [Streptococcus iniae]|uniref:hypothetical protein n=1 Tax=Streptococcus iniae TaxID=1346 RepID=UPI00217CEE87|nr:hypothetical protein [Streptococcus iniae]